MIKIPGMLAQGREAPGIVFYDKSFCVAHNRGMR